MINYRKAAALLFVLVNILFAQIDEERFFYRVNTIYYNLENSKLENFTSWITSNVFEDKIKNVTMEEIFPLEITWVNPNRLFFIKRPLPSLPDTSQYNLMEKLQLELLQELKGILLDWQRYYGGRLLADLPDQYLYSADEDTISLEYEAIEDSKNIRVKMNFNQDGICTKITTTYYDSDQEIVVYPIFNSWQGKLICAGWKVRIFNGQAIESGFDVQVKSQKINGYMLPDKIYMQLQTKEHADKRFIRTYKFRNVILNKKLQILN